MSLILKAENISKQYRLGRVGTGTLNDDLKRWWFKLRGKGDPFLQVGGENDRSIKANGDYVWALKNINFEVKHGEILGIIGKNGAGKSTLLKILSRVTSPTTGIIRTKGRIASLLEVGTGFHGELTGRENIFMNGAVLGMTKVEIKKKLEEIIDFSGCELYIDTPVKRYSSGMTVRLGFAVAAHLEPEIFVVDEVLAVGDAEFQRKALGKMQDLSSGEGRTVLFVSHNISSIRSLCNKGIVLNNGNLSFQGNIEDSIKHYMEKTFVKVLDFNSTKNRTGKGFIKIKKLNIYRGSTIIDFNSLVCGNSYDFEFLIQNHSIQSLHFHVGLSFYSMEGHILNASSSEHTKEFFKIESKSEMRVLTSYKKFPLSAGKYILNISCISREFGLEDFIKDSITIEVVNGQYFEKPFFTFPKNIVLINNSWNAVK